MALSSSFSEAGASQPDYGKPNLVCQTIPTCPKTAKFRDNCTQHLQQQPHHSSQATLRCYRGIFALFLQHSQLTSTTFQPLSHMNALPCINPSPPSSATLESPAMPWATWFRAAAPAAHSHRIQNCLESPDGDCPSCFPMCGLSSTSASVPLHGTQLLRCGKSSSGSDVRFLAPTFPPVTLPAALRTQFSYISAH